jgi:hypothetical protein
MKKPKLSNATSATTATPTPMPAFAPVDRPEDDAGLCDVEFVALVDIVVLKELELGVEVLEAKSLALYRIDTP